MLTYLHGDTSVFNHLYIQRMCSAFPSFLKPPGLNVPDIIIPDDMIPNKATSLSSTGYSVLKPFLNEQDREVDRVLGDGNCLFRAFSKAICGVEDYHLHLRKAIAEFEMDNNKLFRPIHEAVNQTKFNTHVQNIKKQYTWGTSTEITAAATLLQVEVYVATDSYRPGVPMWLQYEPKPTYLLTHATNLPYLSKYNINIQCNFHWIELTHVSSIHFDTTKPLKGYCTLSKPKLEGGTFNVSNVL